MKVGVIGTGYVGITLACLADFGHDIVMVGRSDDKSRQINSGVSPIFEPGMDEVLKRVLASGKLRASTSYDDLKDREIIFVCVGTPSNADGSIDLSQIEEASSQLGEVIKKTNDFKVIVVKSTVVPHTTKKKVLPILEKASGKKAGRDFGLGMIPEFLREGSGVYDFMNPDKIVIGALDERSMHLMVSLFDSFDKKIPRILTDLSTSEMIKYAQNSMLASRISFINEIANICEKFNVDVTEVAHAIGLDSRIGPKFLNAGAGFGGSCFPKDVKALIAVAKSAGINPILLNAIIDVNEKQPHRMIDLAKQAIGDLSRKTISILGLAFKPNTDDMREARVIPVINSLLEHGAKVKVYDPQAMENAKKIFNNSVEYSKTKEECLKNSDLCLIMTEWDEFRKMDHSGINVPIVDGRRVVDQTMSKQLGSNYKGIGWSWN